MPVAKLRGSDRLSLMKPDEGNDFLNTFLRQTTAKEPFLSFSRAGDVPVQLIQLLSALDQQDIPGWPLLSPAKVQMQKCGKCTREYCSSINYRRHLRVHHRLKKLDKDSLKNRELLGAFWDKITEDEAKEILSFKDVMLGEVPGSSILKSLTVAIQSPGYYSLPQYCWRAGSSLLDIIQTSRFPLSSKELFSILDGASEKTFLSGTAVLVQNYIFNGDAGKIGLEMKNIAACISFLLEKKLVKAWVADKDAEALRCQKLLMEEEETAQRRQAELLEKRRQKKLRQKEQKAKEQNQGEKADVREVLNDALETAPEAVQPCGLGTSDSEILGSRNLPDHVASCLEPFEFQNMEEDIDLEAQTISGSEDDMDSDHNLVEHHIVERNDSGNTAIACSHMPQKSQWSNLSNSVHVNSNSQAHKIMILPKHENHYDSRASPLVSGIRKWSRKPILDSSRQSLKSREQKSPVSQLEHNTKSEVLIGSIAVTIGNCGHHEVSNSEEVGNVYHLPENQRLKKYNLPEKHSRPSFMCSTSRSTVMYWRRVSRDGNKDPKVVEIGSGESQVDGITNKGEDHSQSSESCVSSSVVDSDCSRNVNSSCPRSPVSENGRKDPELAEISCRESEIDEICNCQSSDNYVNPTTVDNDLGRVVRESIPLTKFQFSCQAAKAFLSERWKQAISTEHVKITLPKDFEQSGYMHLQPTSQMACGEPLIVGNETDRTVENLITGVRAQESGASTGTIKHRFRKKPEKGFKLKYIPK